ncbi:hypothetical protein Q361_11743 [Flavobacterium croceum DSM 17960]|uniref:Uncharacterized protein n=1 Tax=Flavobacterium croceum DSM 17960 TaxID=1121886 RepID=A0A2S4N5C1_9FLAO|nr:hypothetical protein [Flavobacterium croceum]POS00939.1 hypothetical protein Q361_11743 [Flavobacterium croceum DSM 17960]
MARKFILKAAKSKNDFFLTEPDEFLFFYSPSIIDLRKTLRCITSKGYKIPGIQTFSKRIDAYNGHLILKNPFFKTTMYEIFEIKSDVNIKIKNRLDYTNSFGYSHNLKLIDSESIKHIFNFS